MGRQLLIIGDVTLTDIITNSSSEIFICDTNKTIEAIKEVLQTLLDLIESNQAFEDVFVVKKMDFETFEWYRDYKYYICEERPNSDDYTSENDKHDWVSYDKALSKFYKEKWVEFDKKDDIVIMSASGNTIPYSLFEIIEDIFNAERIHIG